MRGRKQQHKGRLGLLLTSFVVGAGIGSFAVLAVLQRNWAGVFPVTGMVMVLVLLVIDHPGDRFYYT